MSDTETQALVVRQPQAPLSGYVPPPDKSELESMIAMANTLAKAQGFLPAHFFGQPYKILAAILYGRDLGISATNALQHIIVIEGKATADAQLIGMLVRRAGHQMVDTTTDTASTVTITRSDGTVHEATFTMQDAQRAGLVRAGGAWTKYPAAMLYARALTAVARKGAQDALMGTIYTPEELGAEVDGNGAAIMPASAPTGEIPTSQASPETVAALKEAQTGENKSTQVVAEGPNPTVAPEGIRQVAPAQSASSPSVRSVGPRAKRQNVVTAPQAQPAPSVAPAAAVTAPVSLDDEPQDGREQFMATLRQQAREVAAQVVYLRVKRGNVRNKDAIALGTMAPVELPPLTPHAGADASLSAFITSQHAEHKLSAGTLGELSEDELTKTVLGTLEEIVKRLEKEGITAP